MDESFESHQYQTFYCSDCGRSHRVPVYCGYRFCPECSRSRAFKLRSKIKHCINTHQLNPGEKTRFITLTVSSQPDLASMCGFLSRSFRRLRSRAIWKKNYSGGCYVVEVKRNEFGWHAHLHILADGRFVPQSQLLKAWRAIVGPGGLFIKNCPPHKAAKYITDYVTKIPEDTRVAIQISDALKGKRLFQCFGAWHELIRTAPKNRFECPYCGCPVWISEFEVRAACRSA